MIQRLLDRRLSQVQAADILHITTRQIQRLVRAYRQQGVSGIVSKKRGKPNNHMIPQTIKDFVVTLVKANYADFDPTLAAEKLLEVHGLKLAVETVRSLIIKSDIWITRDKKRKRA
ncbi:MAG: helix-turn-helix domain-containing protein [Candidatus Saccharimonadaceae bacterium]